MNAECDKEYLLKKKSYASSLEEELDECTCVTNRPLIVLKENNAKCKIENKILTSVKITRLDPCTTILAQKKKCDFIATWERSENGKNITLVYYIELKGSDHKSAFKQLSETIKHCKHIHASCQKVCYIAAYPPVANATIQRYQKKFAHLRISLIANTPLSTS